MSDECELCGGQAPRCVECAAWLDDLDRPGGFGDDSIPVHLSPGRNTTIRPGETASEATDRLIEGEDL